MNNKYIENNISSLILDESIVTILNKNNINLVKDIWILKRKDLKELGLSDSQINMIIIKLQLNGLDIDGKIYKKS